ncbi:acyltransferase family protein [Methanobrevibacter sp. TMH8]|uniref:acyltransferase family protein n=1 Tax=Methanobrevibacter sp. TMH8 TaxID=2848611 RepID=UPI001CD0131C|nr:acyltransferase family protein [Methanobrevibacter sp. TMH8]MBZ9570433.1 acyltransferase family protein [Methanobrevibacter sp. TMH8]
MFINKINNLSNIFRENSSEKLEITTKNHEESKTKHRINKYDNLKGLAIILVVLGHILVSFEAYSIYYSLRDIIFVFHMPIFFFVAGYFSRTSYSSRLKAFQSLIIPFFLFGAFYYIFRFFLDGSVPDAPFAVPPRGLWFLLSLFLMKLFLPIFDKVKHMFWIALALALFVGIFDVTNNIFALTKTFCFLPAFLLGYYFKNSDKYLNNLKPFIKKIFLKIRDFILDNKKFTILFLILFILAVGYLTNGFNHQNFLFELSYHEMHLKNIVGMAMRLFIISAGLIIVLLLTYVMTNKKTFLTKLGRNSLAIYILHFYFLKFSQMFISKTSIGHLIESNVFLIAIYLFIVVGLIVGLLSRDFVSNAVKWLIDLVNKLLFGDNKNIS